MPLVDTIVYNAKRAEVQGEMLDALASYFYLNDVRSGEGVTRRDEKSELSDSADF